MKRNKQVRAAILVAVMAGLGAMTAGAYADSVSLDTGLAAQVGSPYDSTSGWSVARVLVGSETTGNYDVGNGLYDLYGTGPANSVTYAAQTITPADVLNDGYISGSLIGGANTPAALTLATGLVPDTSAQWVTWSNGVGGTPDAAGAGYSGDSQGTNYVYTESFTLGNFNGPTALMLAAEIASDNLVTNITLTSTDPGLPTVPITYDSVAAAGDGFDTAFSADVPFIPAADFTSPATFTLSVYVKNNDAFSGGPYATGVILTGIAEADGGGADDVSLAPLPASARVGFGLLGVFGAVAAIRKRVRRSSRIVSDPSVD